MQIIEKFNSWGEGDETLPIRILLADDHQVFRHGLKTALDQEPDLEVTAEAENGEQAIDIAAEMKPDVVVMDIHMPGMGGAQAARAITAAHASVKVLALSMYSDEAYVMEMLEAGASGYLLKNCSFEELTTAIRKVAQGKSFLSPEIAGLVMELAVDQRKNGAKAAAPKLTPREAEVTSLVALGHTNLEIADKLCISKATVETHRRQIMRKLQLNSLADLIKFAVREGLTTLDS